MKSSINIQPIKGGSEKHNEREKEYDYVRKDLSHKNESWKEESISNVRKHAEEKYFQNVGQKMQKKATPIREAVFLFDEHHTIEDARKLANKIEEKFGIHAFQIYMHRDEGRWVDKKGETIEGDVNIKKPGATWKQNLHGHMLFDWTDEKGKSIKLNRQDMAKLQTLVAKELKMKRGLSSDKKHLDALTYKIGSRSDDLEKNVSKDVEKFLVAQNGLFGVKIDYEKSVENMKKALIDHRILIKKLRRELQIAQKDSAQLKRLEHKVEQITVKYLKNKKLTPVDILNSIAEESKSVEKGVKFVENLKKNQIKFNPGKGKKPGGREV